MVKERVCKTIKFSFKEKVATITLNRPEIHNAFNEVMIRELLETYREIAEMEHIRVVVLTGEGKSFCAGADLKWMGDVINYSFEQNLNESLQLAELFYTMYTLPKPTIAKVNGAAIGGGTGLVAVNDIVIASERAKFSLSEVKLGLVPACILPYVFKRVGERGCRELFLTGQRVNAEESLKFGLSNQVVPEAELDAAVEKLIAQLITSGPNALGICKDLLEKVPQMSLEQAKTYTAESIAALRISDEGQEGMKAFFEKRPPKWVE